MKEEHAEKEPNNLEIAKEAILNASQDIEREFSKGSNSWLNCFRTVMNVVISNFGLAADEGQISTYDYEKIEEKFVKLERRTKGLNKIYTKIENKVPEDIQEELLRELHFLE